jgi:hypothetical protein
MEEHRQEANEQLMDELAARLDDLERRFEGLLRTLREEHVGGKLGLRDAEFARANPTDMPMGVRTMKHSNARHRAETRLREQDALNKVARIPAETLDELVRGITPSNRPGETSTGRRRGRESW